MAYINFQNCTRQEYEQIIYSQKAKNKVRLIFGGNELLNADRYCEKITMSSRILPNDLSKRFSLDNFVSKEMTIILHDIDPSIIAGQVNVLIGTLVDEENDIYEYVPLGIFNIQGSPVTDKDKVTITLRDNRIKFDFGYNAKPLLDFYGGKATKKQILNDICSKAGVVCDTTTFLGEDDEIGIYDNSITANVYVSYIAEQAGMMPTITRDGHLKFININNATVHKIPLYLLEKYELGKKYTIQRVVYESGIIKYQTSNDETLDTLYVNSANPYIKDQEHINSIYANVADFEIDSIETGKVLGNPAIDPYDLIQIYGYYVEDEYGNKRFVDDDTVIVAQTLANCEFTYRNSMIAEYNTIIGEEERKENVTISGEATYRKYAKTEYDEINGSLSLMAGQINGQNSKLAQMQISVDEINQKIGEVTDITVTAEDTDGQVELEGVNESEPIQIKIHPIGNNISYDYPHNDYPQNDYSSIRTLRFTRSYVEEGLQKTQIIPYELPYDLLYYDQDNYDEFYLDYDTATCQVTKRCVYNSDGTVGLLSTPQVIDIDPYPTINLGDGDYTVCLLGYNQAYLFVRLMASNIYTTQFATKVELNTAIRSTAKSISLTANNGYSSSGIVIKLYNEDGTLLDETEANITMTGLVKFTDLSGENSTTIDGSNIKTGLIKSNNYVANTTGTLINLNNGVIDTKDFKVNSAGSITATGGTIGGWDIREGHLGTSLASPANTYFLSQIGKSAYMDNGGTRDWYLYFKNKFGIDTSGNVFATGMNLTEANVSGTINASSGYIGSSESGWNISSSYIYRGGTGGNNGARLYADGRLYMKNNYGWINTGSGGTLINGNGTSYPVIISDQIGKDTRTSSYASIELSAMYGDLRLATNVDLVMSCRSGSLIIDGYTGQTIDRIIYKDSQGENKYMIFYKGLLVGYN